MTQSEESDMTQRPRRGVMHTSGGITGGGRGNLPLTFFHI